MLLWTEFGHGRIVQVFFFCVCSVFGVDSSATFYFVVCLRKYFYGIFSAEPGMIDLVPKADCMCCLVTVCYTIAHTVLLLLFI